MHCAALDSASPWPSTPPDFRPAIVFWISASCCNDRKRRRRSSGCTRREIVDVDEEEEENLKRTQSTRQEEGGDRVERTNRKRASGKLENGSQKCEQASTTRSWKSDSRSEGGGSSSRLASPLSAVLDMESSAGPSTSGAGGRGEEEGKGGGKGKGGGEEEGGGTGKKKTCGVCGDRAKSYHFGGVSCDSCKAFFRRSVQNDAYRNFRCPYERRCDINVHSRKCCQYCRFHKCLLIGMETGWVMSEEERLQLLRQRMERKAKQQQQQDQPTPAPPGVSDPVPGGAGEGSRPPTPDDASLAAALGAHEAALLREMVDNYASSLHAVPYDVAPAGLASTEAEQRPAVYTVSMVTRTFERITRFAGSLRAFRRIGRTDRATLLRGGMIEACLIRAAFAYDAARDCWPDVGRPQYRGSPCLRVDDLHHLLPPELQTSLARFNRSLNAMQLDERTLMTLLLVVLFSPERHGLEHPLEVARIQEDYLTLLRRYMQFRYQSSARKLFAELLLKLPDLRQLNDAFTQSQLRLSQVDIVHFQHKYGAIQQRRRRHSDAGTASGSSGAGATSATASAPPSPGPSGPRASSAFAVPPASSPGSISPPSYAFHAQPFVAFGPIGALPSSHPSTSAFVPIGALPSSHPSTSTSSPVATPPWLWPRHLMQEERSSSAVPDVPEPTDQKPKNGTGRTS